MYLIPSFSVTSSEFCNCIEKSIMMSSREEITTQCLAVLTEYQNVTDTWIDRWADRLLKLLYQYPSVYCFARECAITIRLSLTIVLDWCSATPFTRASAVCSSASVCLSVCDTSLLWQNQLPIILKIGRTKLHPVKQKWGIEFLRFTATR